MKACPTENLSHEAGHYEVNTRIKNRLAALHRQVDTQDFVFAETETLSPRTFAPATGAVSQRMLTRTLRKLEATGGIVRRVTGAKAIAVEYSLTRLGKTLITPLRGMCRWANRHGKYVSADVHLSEAYEMQ